MALSGGDSSTFVNYKLVAIQLGESLKYDSSLNEIDRMASAIFSFSRQEHENNAISSQRAKRIYDWIMTLADQPISHTSKHKLLDEFVNAVAPEGSAARAKFDEKATPKTHTVVHDPIWALVHPAIRQVSESRFRAGHHADAVEAALKEVNSRVKAFVKDKTGEELDGASLMKHAFSAKSPLILLGDPSTESGRNTQLGFMEIFSGAMTGIRNPKAHANIQEARETALRLLILASVLMEKLDEAKCP